MDENDEERLLKYGVVVLIIIVAIIGIIGISMMDFSNKEDTESISQVNQVKQEIKIGNVKNDFSGIKDENEKENVNEKEDNIEKEDYNDEESEVKMDQILSIMQGKKFVVTENRITSYFNNEYYDAICYYEFDENDMLKGFFLECDCVDYQALEIFYNLYTGIISSENISQSGLHIFVQFPMQEEMHYLTKKQIEEKLSEEYYLEYVY